MASATGGSHIRAFTDSVEERLNFHAFAPQFVSGVTVARGDFNGDGVADIAVGTQLGEAHIKVFDGKSGVVLASFIAFNGYLGASRWPSAT